MAYEALIVIGFGVTLAVVSVALFWAHVKRINAPNKADPQGMPVEIDLQNAIAIDAARAAASAAHKTAISVRSKKHNRRCAAASATSSDYAAASSAFTLGTSSSSLGEGKSLHGTDGDDAAAVRPKKQKLATDEVGCSGGNRHLLFSAYPCRS